MKAYFIRHGQSILTESRHQSPQSPLSDLGIKQSEAIAERFTRIPIDMIISSSYTRALQTAQAIKKIKPVPLIQSDLLIEQKVPTLFLGKLTNDPEIVPMHQTIREHFYDPQWHYAEEENFSDLIARANRALNLIHAQQKENIVIVTHGYFLTIIIFSMLFGETITPQSFKSFREHTANSNTGLTFCEYRNKR